MASGNVRERNTKHGKVYQITIENGRDPITGERIREYITFKGTRKQAEAEKNRLVAAVTGGNYVVNTSSLPLSVWMKEWLDLYCVNVEATTKVNYEGQINRYLPPEIGRISVKALQNAHIQAWINKMIEDGLSPKTIRNVYMNINAALKKAVLLKMINSNPCDGTVLPKRVKPQFKIYTTDEMNDMLSKAKGTCMYFPLLLETVTGLRRGELLALRWSDIDFDNRVIHITRNRVYAGRKGVIEKAPKSKAGVRNVTFGKQFLKEAIKARNDYIARKEEMGCMFHDDDYVICQENGKPYHPQTWKCKWERFLKREGLEHIRFHDLRHSNVTALIEAGVTMKAVSYRIGHANISTTMDIYAHCTSKMQHDAGDAIDNLIFC